MKKVISIYMLVILIAITACLNDKKKPADKKEKKAHTLQIAPDTSRILMSKTYLHTFSDPFKPDTFKISLIGSSISKAKFIFEIISFNNKKIYSEKDSAYDLLGDLDDMTVKQNEDTISVRFNNFLRADAFTAPAMDR
jgi:hypothetical protein